MELRHLWSAALGVTLNIDTNLRRTNHTRHEMLCTGLVSLGLCAVVLFVILLAGLLLFGIRREEIKIETAVGSTPSSSMFVVCRDALLSISNKR